MKAYNVEASNIDICSFRGDSIRLSFEVKMNGKPHPDFSDAQIDIGIRKYNGEHVKLFTSAGEKPTVEIDPGAGIYSICSLEGLPEAGVFFYDVQLTVPNGEVTTIQYGRWIARYDQTMDI
jgi:hypothetical protein